MYSEGVNLEVLTEDEIELLPEIKRMRVGKEPVPRCVLFVSRKLPITREDIRWAKEMMEQEYGEVI